MATFFWKTGSLHHAGVLPRSHSHTWFRESLTKMCSLIKMCSLSVLYWRLRAEPVPHLVWVEFSVRI